MSEGSLQHISFKSQMCDVSRDENLKLIYLKNQP